MTRPVNKGFRDRAAAPYMAKAKAEQDAAPVFLVSEQGELVATTGAEHERLRLRFRDWSAFYDRERAERVAADRRRWAAAGGAK